MNDALVFFVPKTTEVVVFVFHTFFRGEESGIFSNTAHLESFGITDKTMNIESIEDDGLGGTNLIEIFPMRGVVGEVMLLVVMTEDPILVRIVMDVFGETLFEIMVIMATLENTPELAEGADDGMTVSVDETWEKEVVFAKFIDLSV